MDGFRVPGFICIASPVNPQGHVKEAPPTNVAIPGNFGLRNRRALFGQNAWTWKTLCGRNFGDIVLLGGGYWSQPCNNICQTGWGLLRPPILKKSCFQLGCTSKKIPDTNLGTVVFLMALQSCIPVKRCKTKTHK